MYAINLPSLCKSICLFHCTNTPFILVIGQAKEASRVGDIYEKDGKQIQEGPANRHTQGENRAVVIKSSKRSNIYAEDFLS